MARTVRDVMTADPATIESSQSIQDAASLMRQYDTGAVVVTEDGRVVGIVTDRDIAIRAVADGKGPDTAVREACSSDLETVAPDYSLEQAVQLMRQRAVRRLPVVEADRAVGILSIGDLAMERDSDSALADISAAPGND
jgi:CBS domain-containing protein